MIRVLFAAMTLGALAAPSDAGEAVVRLHVDRMPAPVPALRYRLLPEVRELIPGNAAQEYLKCFMEQRYLFFSRKGVDERTRYLAMPLAELSKASGNGYGGFPLKQADRAARMTGIDWQTVPLVQEGKIETLPAELGPLQVLAEALRVRMRVEVAGRRFDDAVRTASTLFALGRHLGEYPAGLANRLGISIVHLGLAGLEEMIEQPGCPNLYWALADLPCPLVDLRKGVQGDSSQGAATLASIRGDAPMSEPEIERHVSRVSGLIGFRREQLGLAPRNLRATLTARANDPDQVEQARRRLLVAGSAASIVEKLPPIQAILLDEKRAYEIDRDARLTRLAVPVWRLNAPGAGAARPAEGTGAFDDLLPQVDELRRSQAELEQEIALLRHVEAIRLHASEHTGRVPEALSAITVPLPEDPLTGTPFEYAVEGSTACLRGGSPGSGGAGSDFAVRFEVIVRD